MYMHFLILVVTIPLPHILVLKAVQIFGSLAHIERVHRNWISPFYLLVHFLELTWCLLLRFDPQRVNQLLVTCRTQFNPSLC